MTAGGDHDHEEPGSGASDPDARGAAGGLGGEDRSSTSGAAAGSEDQAGAASDLPEPRQPYNGALTLPPQSPLFHAQHAGRYDRQNLIQVYEATYNCRLIVMIDDVFPDAIAMIEDLIYNADPDQDLHLLLDSPGGDGETAIRIIRSLQARCRELTVIVCDQAKSAATLIVLGAHHILMGPTSDLGPIDPQFRVPRSDGYFELVAAKDIVAAVDRAMKDIEASPETFPLHASLLSDVNALMVQAARTAIARSDDLLMEAISACTDRHSAVVQGLCETLHDPLIDSPKSHGMPIDLWTAQSYGLPVTAIDYRSEQWQLLWRLYTKYFELDAGFIYEGRHSSQVGRTRPFQR